MVATIDQVRASNPSALVEAGTKANSAAAAAEKDVSQGNSINASLGGGWKGDASDAATRQGQRNVAELQSLQSMYKRLGAALSQGGGQLTTIRSSIVSKVDQLTQAGWQVAPDGTVSVKPGGPMDTLSRMAPALAMKARLLSMGMSADLKKELAAFTTADSNLADAVGAATRPEDAPQDPGKPKSPDQPTPGPGQPEQPSEPPKDHKDTVPGPHPGEPGYKTGLTPTTAGTEGDQLPMKPDPGSSDKIRLQDNPPGYNGPAGPERDAAWQKYLSQSNGTAPGKVDPATLVLPNPAAVSDPGLKTVGAAAKQQGVSYAWGGGHNPDNTGVSKGHKATAAEVGADNIPDESWTYNDQNRTGFDCSGLARFATEEGHGVNTGIGSGNTVSQFNAMTGNGAHSVIPDSALKPGDLIYYGPPGASHHVAVYAGNGLMIEASGSGHPVEVSPIRGNGEQHQNVHVGS